MGTNCWSDGRSVGGKKVYVPNKDDYLSLLCICACSEWKMTSFQPFFCIMLKI
jgi:hypothetical protein